MRAVTGAIGGAAVLMASLLAGGMPAQAQNSFNPVAGSEGFHVMTENDARLVASEGEGSYAIGGDLTIGGVYNVAIHSDAVPFIAPGDAHPTGLVVGGGVDWTASEAADPDGLIRVLSNTYVKIGDLSDSAVHTHDQNGALVADQITPAGAAFGSTPRIELTTPQPEESVQLPAGLIDFADAFANFRDRSAGLAACGNNVTLEDPDNPGQPLPVGEIPTSGRVRVILTEGEQNVLNLTAPEFESLHEMTFVGTSPSLGTPLVVNVSGETVDWPNMTTPPLSIQNAPYVLWNMPDATQVNRTQGDSVEGTVYAPRALLNDGAVSNIEGDIIVRELEQTLDKAGGEYHYAPFAATLTSCQGAPEEGALTLTKDGTLNTDGTITYTYTAENSFAADATDFAITDTTTGGGTVTGIICPDLQNDTLPADTTTTCTATYTPTPGEVTAGAVTNHATAHGTVDGTPETSEEATVTVAFTPTPVVERLSLTKSAEPPTVGPEGGTVTYTYKVANTGAVDVEHLAITDTVAGNVDMTTCDPGLGTDDTLPAGDSTTCSATFNITPQELEAGHGAVTNEATATGVDISGTPITSNTPTATVEEEGLALTKSVEPSTVSGAGAEVTYIYTVENIGDVDIHGITIADNVVPSSAITCTPDQLTPGQEATCTAKYTISQSNALAGGVTNTARAQGLDTSDNTVSSGTGQATVTVKVPTTVSLRLGKSVSAVTVSKAGTKVTYTYTVTNTGNAPLDKIRIADNVVPSSAITCQPDTVAPAGETGDSTTCTAAYTFTKANMAAGGVTNTATAYGTGPNGEVGSNTVQATVTVKVPAPRPCRCKVHKKIYKVFRRPVIAVTG